jgi:Sec-independent protein translocase protein TatA
MDGIFGVGIAEMLIIVIVILVVGGPKNAVKWARELGLMMAKVRKMWASMVKELEKDMGEEAKELVKVTQELRQGVTDMRTAPQKVIREATKMIEETEKEVKAPLALPAETPSTPLPPTPPPEASADAPNPAATPDKERYSAWTAQPD